MTTVAVTTDTATICLFDLAALRHRKDDVGDWWSIARDMIAEMNAGTILALETGLDGTFEVEVCFEQRGDGPGYGISVPSGRVYIGHGEQISGGGLEPDPVWGGVFIDLEPGNYRCWPERKGAKVRLRLSEGGDGRNALTTLIDI